MTTDGPNETVTSAPPPAALAAVAVPPCASAAWRTIAARGPSRAWRARSRRGRSGRTRAEIGLIESRAVIADRDAAVPATAGSPGTGRAGWHWSCTRCGCSADRLPFSISAAFLSSRSRLRRRAPGRPATRAATRARLPAGLCAPSIRSPDPVRRARSGPARASTPRRLTPLRRRAAEQRLGGGPCQREVAPLEGAAGVAYDARVVRRLDERRGASARRGRRASASGCRCGPRPASAPARPRASRWRCRRSSAPASACARGRRSSAPGTGRGARWSRRSARPGRPRSRRPRPALASSSTPPQSTPRTA